MKSMIILKNLKRKRKMLNLPPHNSFSIFEMFKTKFPINYSPKRDEVNSDRNLSITSGIRKIKKDKAFTNDIVKAYLMEEDNAERDIKLDIEVKIIPEESLDHPVLLTKLMHSIVYEPHMIHTQKEQFNQTTFYKILLNSSIVKDLNTKKSENIQISQWQLKNLLTLFKFIQLMYSNYPNLISENEILNIFKKSFIELKIQTDKLNQRLEEILILLDINYELIKLRDIMVSYSPPVDKVFLNTFKSFLIQNTINFTDRMQNLTQILKLDKSDSKANILFKYFFILAKISTLKHDYNFPAITSTKSNEALKENLDKFLNSLSLHQNDYFRNNKEKTILFYLSLEKLGLLNKNLVRLIKFDNLNWDSLHVLYKTLLYKPEYTNEVDLASLNEMTTRNKVRRSIIENYDNKKLLSMRDTIDWYIKSSLNFVNFHNQLGTIQYFAKRRIYDIIFKLLESVNRVSNPNEIIHLSYFLSQYVADPNKEFEILSEKTFDIEEVNPVLLNKFLDSVDFRIKYSIRYDHEIFILSKFKKEFFVPYNNNLDKFIIYITKQFLYKFDTDVQMSAEIFLAGLKCLKIVIKNDIINPNYQISESIIQSLRPFVTKCLLRGSKYMKYINPNNIDTIDILTQIIPFIKYFTLKKSNNQIDNYFDNFILNLVKQDYNKLEDRLRMCMNITEYLILENLKINTSGGEIPNTFSDIIAYVYKHIENILISKEDDSKLNMKIINNSEFFESKIPVLLVNLHNVFSLEKEKYSHILTLLQNYMQEKKGLRSLRGYELLKIKKDLMNVNSLFQILSNFQTIQTPKNKNKDNLLTFILNEDNLKIFLNDIINTLNEISITTKADAVETTTTNRENSNEGVSNANDSNNNSIFSQFNFSSFSYLISNIFEKVNTEEITKIFQILGNTKVENYHPMFIKNILTRYSDRDLLFSLIKKKEEEFFNLALHWPLFIKNEELIRAILHCHLSKLLQFKRYEIITVLTHNRINHTKLFAFFGASIRKIKNPALRKKILSDYVHNCTYIGYKIDVNLYEEILSIYFALSEAEALTFTTGELTDIIALSIISNILDTSLAKENQKVYYSILNKINRKFVNKLELKADGSEISYYPSIRSDDRYFQKSLSFVTNKEGMFDMRDDNEEDKTEEEGASPVYMRKTGEGFFTIDNEFENYFMKKRELMYGHQVYLNDNMALRNIMKKWLISKLFGINLDDEYLENQLEQIFTLLKKNSNNTHYENFYLKLLSYAFQYNFVIESEYKDRDTGLKIDYLVEFKDKKIFIVIVPEEFISHDIETDKKHPDGVYALYFECIKRLVDVQVIPVLQSDLENLSDADYHFLILDKILDK